MKFQSILLLAALVGFLAVVALAADEASNELKEQTNEVAEKPSLGKVMSFEFYMQKYGKHYANAAEMARRAKLFMARAFRVFISSIKYLCKRASKFLKINPHSDWTESERDVITMDDRDGPKESNGKADIERLLEDPKFASFLDAQRDEHKRKKRNVETRAMKARRERKLSVEDLIGEPQPEVEMPAKYAPSVPSNNPDYEQPQVISEGVDDEEGEQVDPLSQEEAAELDKIEEKQGGYLSSLTQGIKNVYGYLTKDDLAGVDEELEKKYKLEANSFEDEEEEEYDDDDEEEQSEEDEGYEGEPDEMYLDYRDTGCLLQPKNQKRCGSCYAFTAMALMEYHHCRQKGKLVPFSEQYIIDCGKGRSKGIDGCDGGQAAHVGYFVNQYGLELSADYPYRAKELTCPYSSDTSSKHMGHSKLEDVEVIMVDDEKYLDMNTIEWLLTNKGPLFFSIYTGSDFADFGGGVDHLRCDPEKPFGHAMVLVGHGREDGVDYWLIRNSHGVSYGLQGHYKLAKDVPVECVLRVGYVNGQFKRNRNHKGKALFNELKKQSLLANFAQ